MNIAQKAIDYLKSAKEEFKKVSWPSRKDTFRYSALVIGVSIVVSAFFAGLDATFAKMVDAGISYRNQVQAGQVALPAVTASTSQPVTIPGNSQPTQTPAIDLNGATPIKTPAATPSAPVTIPVPTNK